MTHNVIKGESVTGKNRLRVILTFLMLFGPEALVVEVGVLTGN